MKASIAFVVSLFAGSWLQGSAHPERVVTELLDTDRAFAAGAAKSSAATALAAMLADDVVMPTAVPKPGFARGKALAAAALSANPDNVTGKVSWTPIRAGVSADGRHGFTVGYMTLARADGTTQPIKYVAYWLKQEAGWRIAVYKRVPADASPSATVMMPPAVPAQIVAPVLDEDVVARHKASLVAAEQAFSDEAQKIGLGPAFARHGSTDAVNVGPRTSPAFVVGAADIGRAVGAGSEGKPSPVAWAADEGALVASTGDLGVTFGYIRQNAAPQEGRPGAVPFITIWRRATAGAPWRYVAE